MLVLTRMHSVSTSARRLISCLLTAACFWPSPLFAQNNPSDYKWVTGEPVTFSNWGNWAGSRPDRLSGMCAPAYYVFMWFDRGWEDTDDAFNEGGSPDPQKAIFEANKKPATPLNWMQWKKANGGNDHWYALSSKVGKWTVLQAEAKSFGGHIVTINSKEESAFLHPLFFEAKLAWIGLYRDGDASSPTPNPNPNPTPVPPPKPPRVRGYIPVNLRESTRIIALRTVTPAQARADLRVPTAR